MATYIVYTYQFTPMTSVNLSIEHDILPLEERMKKKQEYLEKILSNENFSFHYKNAKYASQTLLNYQNVHIYKLANNRQVKFENDFKVSTLENHPSVHFILDNREDHQRLLIEDNPSSFSDTDVVRNIIKATLLKLLKEYGLCIDIQREYQASEFWDIVNRYESISMVRFHIQYPNLPRVNESIKKMLSDASAATNSKRTTLELRSNEDESLELDRCNEDLVSLAKASADSGSQIVLKAKKIKRQIKTGNTKKSIEFEDVEMMIRDDLLGKGVDKLFTKLKEIE